MCLTSSAADCFESPFPLKTYIRLLFAFLALSLLAAAVVGVVWVFENLIKPEQSLAAEVEEIRARPKAKIDLGANVHKDAVARLRVGDRSGAVQKLHELMRIYRDSSFYAEAKRVVGEINMDRLLSKEPAPGKVEYVVQRGDSLSRIAGETRSTVGYLMHINGRMGTNLQPGDQLIVCPLEFTVVVDVAGGRLTLRTAEDRFFKEYPLVGIKRPPNTGASFDTTVKGLVIGTGSRLVPVGTREYIEAPKELRCERAGVAIRALSGDADRDKYLTGIFVEPEDLEELALVLRPGTKVLVRKELKIEGGSE